MISNSYSINAQYYRVKVWLSRDPIEERGGLNLYVIGDNDLVNKWDYLGQMMRPVPKETMIDVVGNAPNGDFIVKVVEVTTENRWKRKVGMNGLRKTFASINCKFFEHGFRTGGTPLPRGSVGRYANLIELDDEIRVPAAEFVRTGAFLADALRSVLKEPYAFEELLDAMYAFKANSRSYTTCLNFCGKLHDYFGLATGPLDGALKYTSAAKCVSECNDKCCTE